MHLSVLQAVAAAGKNKDRPPHTIIDEKLKLDQDPTTSWNQRVSRGPAVDVSLLYEIIQLDRAAFVQRCRRLRQTGRADPLIALRAQLYELIQSSPDLDQVQVDTLKADVHYHTCTLFGKEMEVPTFSCFQKTTENSPFFTSHDTLVFQNRHASSDAQNKQKRQLTVMGSVDVLQLQLRGLLDMKAAGNVFEVKNRLWPEEEMKAEYRWAAHAQILVYIALTPAAEQPIGYLVEHMRVGAGDTLEIEYREGNFSVFTENYQCVTQATATKRTRARDAGVMVITRYSRQQAKDFLEEFLLPGLDKFVTVYDKLAAQPDVKEAYRRCANRDIFYNQQ